MEDTFVEMYMIKLTDIEGIGVTFSKMLLDAGIDSQKTLLEVCATRRGRENLAKKTQIHLKLILKWTNQADLARISGIGGEYGELLERAGVDSVIELAQRNPESLHAIMAETNERLSLVRHVPGLHQIKDWVAQAKSLPKVVSH